MPRHPDGGSLWLVADYEERVGPALERLVAGIWSHSGAAGAAETRSRRRPVQADGSAGDRVRLVRSWSSVRKPGRGVVGTWRWRGAIPGASRPPSGAQHAWRCQSWLSRSWAAVLGSMRLDQACSAGRRWRSGRAYSGNQPSAAQPGTRARIMAVRLVGMEPVIRMAT